MRAKSHRQVIGFLTVLVCAVGTLSAASPRKQASKPAAGGIFGSTPIGASSFVPNTFVINGFDKVPDVAYTVEMPPFDTSTNGLRLQFSHEVTLQFSGKVSQYSPASRNGIHFGEEFPTASLPERSGVYLAIDWDGREDSVQLGEYNIGEWDVVLTTMAGQILVTYRPKRNSFGLTTSLPPVVALQFDIGSSNGSQTVVIDPAGLTAPPGSMTSAPSGDQPNASLTRRISLVPIFVETGDLMRPLRTANLSETLQSAIHVTASPSLPLRI